MQAVVEELQGVGLIVNADKTAAWTRDAQTVLPDTVEALRVDKLEVLGATAPWLERDGDYSNLGVHSFAEGQEVVQSATTFVTDVVELREAGLSYKAAFVLLRAF